MDTKQIKRRLAKLGADPAKSGVRFLLGFLLFMAGVALVMHGYRSDPLWQVPGLLLLAIGLPVALWGWLGLLANRLFHFFYSQ